jgi:lysophospholipase L1-like esterase
MLFNKPTTLLFVGDSITDCGRNKETGGTDLGAGYVAQVQAMLEAHHPESKIQYLNTGISGNRVPDLEERWDRDVLDHKPDWVSIMIGINDVWRQFDRPLTPQVSLKAYSEKLEALIERTLPQVEGMIVMSPYFLEKNPEDPMRAMMDRYGAEARAIAERHGLRFVDVQAAFNVWLEQNNSLQLCSDRVHPNAVGHNIIASAFLNAIGFEW